MEIDELLDIQAKSNGQSKKEFYNIPEKMKEVLDRSTIKLCIVFFIAIAYSIFILIYSLKDLENIQFTLGLTIFLMLVAGVAGIGLNRRRAKSEYLSYKLLFNEGSIEISSNSFKKTIDLLKVKKVTKDQRGNISIYTKYLGKISIPDSINDINSLSEEISKYVSIKGENSRWNIIQYLPGFFFVAFLLVRFIPDYRLYIFIGFGFVVTTIYSILFSLRNSYKKLVLLPTMAIELFFVYLVSKNIFSILVKMLG